MENNNPSLWKNLLPTVTCDIHKYKRGLSLIISGHMTGAAALSGYAAQRIGTGIVWMAARKHIANIYRLLSPSWVIKEFTNTGILKEIIFHKQVNAVLIGPGLDEDLMARESVLNAMQHQNAVLDGTALTLLSTMDLTIWKNIKTCIITPHAHEFSILFPDLTGDRQVCAKLAAERTGSIIVLKGAETIIASHNRIVINRHSSPYLATAGSGDVLAGMIVSLLAQKMPAFEAALAAVWIHGDIGQRLSQGLIADDIPDAIPYSVKCLQL